jgi:hypothetical protein
MNSVLSRHHQLPCLRSMCGIQGPSALQLPGPTWDRVWAGHWASPWVTPLICQEGGVNEKEDLGLRTQSPVSSHWPPVTDQRSPTQPGLSSMA